MVQVANEIRNIGKNLEANLLREDIERTRENLERLIKKTSKSKPVRDRNKSLKNTNKKIKEILEDVFDEDSFEAKHEKLLLVDNLIVKILRDFGMHLNRTTIDSYEHLRQDVRAFAETFFGLHEIQITEKPRKISLQIQTLSSGFHLISKAIHDTPRIFMNPLVLIGFEILCKYFIETVRNFEFRSQNASENAMFETNKLLLQNSIAAILWKINELSKGSQEKTHYSNFRIPERLSLKERHELVDLLDSWEEIEDKDEQIETLEYIKNADEGRSRKLFETVDNNS